MTGGPAGVDVLAFKKGTAWSVIVVNNAATGSAPVDLRITLPASSTTRSTGVFQTSATKDLAAISRPRYRAAAGAMVRVPSQSVTTYTFADA
ncbi:MAG TPA: hypothetical protein VGF11_04500 [Acidimicrobiales bacterium]